MDRSLLLRPVEAAQLLGISVAKCREMLQSGELPGVVRIGRSVRISRSSLEQWVAQQTGEAKERTSP